MITERQRGLLVALSARGDWTRAKDIGGEGGSNHGGILANLYDHHLVMRRNGRDGPGRPRYEYKISGDGIQALQDYEHWIRTHPDAARVVTTRDHDGNHRADSDRGDAA